MLKKTSVRTKIMSIIYSSMLPLFLVVIVFLSVLNNSLYTSLDNNIKNDMQSVRNAFDSFKYQTFIYARMIAGNFIVQNGVYFRKTGMLDKYLEPVIDDIKVDLINVYKNDGHILTQAHTSTDFKRNDIDKPSVQKALRNGLSTFSVEPCDDTICLSTTCPIYHETITGKIVGAVTVGYYLNHQFATSLHHLSGAEVLVTQAGTILASSFDSEDDSSLIHKTLDYNDRLKIHDVTYDLAYVPILHPDDTSHETMENLGTSHDQYPLDNIDSFRSSDSLEAPSPKGLEASNPLGIVIAVNNSKIQNTLFWTIFLIAILFIGTTIIATVFSFSVASQIIQSIKKINAATETFSTKNFDTLIDINSQDEFKKVADTFNQMATNIKQYAENLEQMVQDRTRELNVAYKKLQSHNNEMIKQLNMAKRVQESIMSDASFKNHQNGFKASYEYIAMETVGGDFFDIIPIDESQYAFIIADVSGHGIPAALITMMAKVLFNSYTNPQSEPDQVCALVNKDLFQLIGDLEYYLTGFYGILNIHTGEFRYANAGHLTPFLLRYEQQTVEELNTEGHILGSININDYQTQSVTLARGDKILFYTDGITETRNLKNEFYKEERLKGFLFQNQHLELNDFIQLLLQEIDTFCGGNKPTDDRALLLVEFLQPIAESRSHPFTDHHLRTGLSNDDSYHERQESMHYHKRVGKSKIQMD